MYNTLENKNIFGGGAQSYDSSFSESWVGLEQRKSVWQYLTHYTSKNRFSKIFEVNCGTGEDALFLASLGHKVFATDISKEMIDVSKAKLEKKSNYDLEFAVEDIRELKFEPECFNLVFSNFGGFNCLNKKEIQKFGQNISKILEPEGSLIIVLMGKKCLWERFYYLIKRQSKSRKRRMQSEPVFAKINDKECEVRYYSPNEIVELLQPLFEVQKVKPIGLFIPPSYLNSYFENKIFIKRILSTLEHWTRNWDSTSDYADHYLIHLKIKNKFN